MLESIKKYFEINLSTEEPDDIDHQLKLATAALLVEMMRQDYTVKEEERAAVKKILREKFELDNEETEELFTLAQRAAGEAVDYHQFTSLIAHEYPQEQKVRIIEYLWMIAYADKKLNPLEEHMIRRIADLIYVSHRDFIKTKHRAEKAVNSEEGIGNRE